MAVMLLEWVFTSIFLILVVLALRAALGKRVSAGLRYALWAVVLVRLLVPVQLFTSPIAGTWVVTEKRTEQVVDNVEKLYNPSEDDVLNSLGGQAGPSATLTTFPNAPSAPTLPDAPEPPAAPDLTKLSPWLGWIWMAGSAAVFFVLLLSNLRFFWKLRRERVLLEGTGCPLRVYAAVNLPSPCLLGIVRPAIYVTPEAAADPDMLRHVLAHEHTHYRHGDHIWSLLRCAALVVHWWNPLVWVSAVLSQRDAELACDEGALKRLGDGERAGYGGTLLALVTAKPRPADLFRCATTMAGDKKSLKERITRIAQAPKRVIWAVVVAVLVTALACVCAFGQAEPVEPEEDVNGKTELSFSINESGLVDITGTVLGMTLEPGTYWQPTGSPARSLSMPYEPFTDGIKGYMTAWWETPTSVSVTTYMMALPSSSAFAGYWNFTVDLSGEEAIVTRMAAQAGLETPEGAEVRMYPETISDEEAIRAARIAAKLMTEAEDYYYSSVSALPVEVEIAFPYTGNNPTSSFAVPKEVLKAAKDYVAKEFRGFAPDGWGARDYDYQTGEWVVTNSDPSYFDRVRINHMEGPWLENRQGVQVEVWRINYEYHTTMPEKERSRLAGGMYITEDGWKCVTYPNCTYLSFRVVGDERRFLTAFMDNMNSPEADDEFKDYFYSSVDALLKGDPIDLPQADLNRNGVPEELRVIGVPQGTKLEVWEDGKLLYEEEGYFAHAGYNALFLYHDDDGDYLLRYNPYMAQGWCDYSYQLFTLTPDGEEQAVRENSIEFSINIASPMIFGGPDDGSFDPEKIAAFVDEINGLLAHSTQLINTDADLLGTFQDAGRLVDTLWWLDTWEPVFTRDPAKSLLENLRDFKEAMEEQWYVEEPEIRSIDEQNRHFLLTYQNKSVQFGGPDAQYQYGMDPQVVDLNGDGRDEIVFTAKGDHSNGYRQENLYIFDAETLERYDTDNIYSRAYSQIQSTGDGENFYLSAPGMEQVALPVSIVQDWDGFVEWRVFDAIEFGWCWYFDVDPALGTMSLVMWGCGSSEVVFCAGIRVDLELTQTGVEPVGFSYVPGPVGDEVYS